MNKKLNWLIAAVAAIYMLPATAQTNPAAVSLPFSLNSQSAAALPAGVAIHRFSSIQTTRTLLPATGDLPVQGSSPTGNAGGWYYLGADGIGLLASGTNPAGAVVVAINTTGLSNISVSWLCRTIYNQASRDNSVALQYRIGTAGNFTNLGTASAYSSAGQSGGSASPVFTEVLPAAAENQPVVQLRWIYWESVSTSGSRDKIAVDNIAVSGSGIATCNAPGSLAAGNVTDSGAEVGWHAAAGASAYEYAVTAAPSIPSGGILTADTSIALSGLSAGTTYYVYVRSHCSGGNVSAWSADTFTTSAGTADASFTVMSYNLLNYPGSTAALREPAYRTIIGAAQPDVLVVQELSSPSGLNSFLYNVLNYSGAGYSAGTLIDGPDSDNGIYFKSSLFQFISNTPIHTDLRDISEFKLKHIASGDTLIIYSAHLKASNAPGDELQRKAETDSLRTVTDALDPGRNFLVCGDFNIYGAYEAAYQNLTQDGNNPEGRFNDVLSMSGTWNNPVYAAYHTQSPRTTSFGGGATGGMDDRFDMFLFSNAIVQSGGFDIISNSYKAFGNDGQHYNQALNTPPYTMYDSVLAAALHDASDHLPVVVKMVHSGYAPLAATLPLQLRKNHTTITQLLTLYPNPAHHTVFIKVAAGYTAPLHLQLYNINGSLVRTLYLDCSRNGGTCQLDLSALPGGIYYLKAPEVGGVGKIVHY